MKTTPLPVYSGVYKSGDRFKAAVTRCGKQHYLGMFYSEREAATAADRALLRTLAWQNGRKDRYNFEFDAKQQLQNPPTEQELAMIEWLRRSDPGAERRAEFADKMSYHTPDDMLELLELARLRLIRETEAVSTLILQTQGQITSMAREMTEIKEKNAFLTGIEAESRQALTTLKAVGKVPGAQWQFKKVEPKSPEVFVSPPMPPEVIAPVEVTAQTEQPPSV